MVAPVINYTEQAAALFVQLRAGHLVQSLIPGRPRVIRLCGVSASIRRSRMPQTHTIGKRRRRRRTQRWASPFVRPAYVQSATVFFCASTIACSAHLCASTSDSWSALHMHDSPGRGARTRLCVCQCKKSAENHGRLCPCSSIIRCGEMGISARRSATSGAPRATPRRQLSPLKTQVGPRSISRIPQRGSYGGHSLQPRTTAGPSIRWFICRQGISAKASALDTKR